MDSNAILDSNAIIKIKLITVGLITHGCLFKHIHVVKLEALTVLANDPLKRFDWKSF